MPKIKYLCRSNFKASQMSIELIIRDHIIEAIAQCYNQQIDSSLVQLQNTRKEFEGDITLVVFPVCSDVEKIAGTNCCRNR